MNTQSWEDLARSAALREGAVAEHDVLRELLSFQLDGSPYAVPVERVREIVRIRQITPIPRVPETVLGVIALRGEIVQVLDLRAQLHLERSGPTRASRIVVLHGDEDRVTGLLVDRVDEVLRVEEGAIRPAGTGDSAKVRELCSRGDSFVSILDPDRIMEFEADV